MGKAGRKPKAGLRYPSGELKKPTTQAALNQIADARRRHEQSVVLNQPHRRGEANPWAESPLGRLCLRLKLRRELYDAGMNYASIVACWRGAKGIPKSTGRSTGGSGQTPADDAVLRWQTQMLEIERAVDRYGIGPLLALRTLVLDEAEVGIEHDGAAMVALQAAAVELGLMKQHAEPFAI